MNRTRIRLVAAGLLAGLAFYLAHRSDLTLSNRLVRAAAGSDGYETLRHLLRPSVPWPRWLTGSLPSALWCFIVAGGCVGWRWRVPGREAATVPLGWGAALFNLGWELVQAAGWTDGRADWRDAVAGGVGCAVAQVWAARVGEPADPRGGYGLRVAWALALVASMGMADVWR